MSLIYFGVAINLLIGNLVKLIALYLCVGSGSHLIQIHDVSKLAYFQNKRRMYYSNVILIPQAFWFQMRKVNKVQNTICGIN